MAEIVNMPKLSDTMTEGVVSSWLKKVGDTVKSGDILAEIETDKATMEFESYYDGVLLHQGVAAGEAAPVDSLLAVIGRKGEDISKILKEAKAEVKAGKEEEEVKEEKEVKEVKEENCLLYTSDAADERSSVDLGGRRLIKTKNRAILMMVCLSQSTVL